MPGPRQGGTFLISLFHGCFTDKAAPARFTMACMRSQRRGSSSGLAGTVWHTGGTMARKIHVTYCFYYFLCCFITTGTLFCNRCFLSTTTQKKRGDVFPRSAFIRIAYSRPSAPPALNMPVLKTCVLPYFHRARSMDMALMKKAMLRKSAGMALGKGGGRQFPPQGLHHTGSGSRHAALRQGTAEDHLPPYPS